MKFHILFLITFLLLFSFSCSKSRYQEIELPDEYYMPGKTELKIDISWSESLSGNIMSIIQLYSTVEDNVSFDAVVYPELSLLESIGERFSTGDFPDIFFLRPSSVTNRLIEENRILDLKPLLDDNPELKKEFIYNELWNGVSSQEKIYGLPLIASYGCMVVSRNISSTGISIPDRIGDFYPIADKLKFSDYSVFRTASLGELRQLVSSLIVIYSGGLDFNSDQSENIKNGFVKSIHFLRDMIRLGMYDVGHLVQNNLYSFPRREALFHFITGMDDKFLENSSEYEYYPYPSAVGDTGSIVFSPGTVTLFVSNNPGRGNRKIVSDFVNFLITSKSLMYYTSRKKILNLSGRAGNQSVYHPVTDLLSFENIRISLSPEQFYTDILDFEFILEIAELLMDNQDPEKWWENYFPEKAGSANVR